VHLHSGLRILDAAKLRPEKVVNGKLLLYTAKTGVPVWCPLPPPRPFQAPLVRKFFFAVRSKNPVTIAEYYRVKLEKAAIAAGLAAKRTKGELRRRNEIHPQRFRDTFFVRLLEKGISIEQVATLRGNSVRVCERHHAPWVFVRQTA
jgi:integrase